MLQLVIDAVPGLIAYWCRDGVCRFANCAYEDWFGYTKAEMVGMTYRQLLGASVTSRNEFFIEQVLSGEPQRFEQDLTLIGGQRVPTLTSYVPDVVDGRVKGFIAHVTDVSPIKDTQCALEEEITERQRALRLLRAQADALEEAQRLGQIGSWSWIAASDTVNWSKELYRIMGFDAASPAPKFAQQNILYSHESWVYLRAAVEIALRTGEPYRLRLDYIRPTRRKGWMDARGEAVRDIEGRIIGLRGTVRNLTGALGFE